MYRFEKAKNLPHPVSTRSVEDVNCVLLADSTWCPNRNMVTNNINNKVFIADAKISQVHNTAVHIQFDIS